jgi:hypothetical protein
VSWPRTSVSPARRSFTHKSRKREDEEKHEPVEDQCQSFEATGTESETVNNAEHEGGEGPTSIEHGFCDRVQPLRSALVPHFLPSGIPKVRPDPGPREEGEAERGDRADGTVPPRDRDQENDGDSNCEDVRHVQLGLRGNPEHVLSLHPWYRLEGSRQ